MRRLKVSLTVIAIIAGALFLLVAASRLFQQSLRSKLYRWPHQSSELPSDEDCLRIAASVIDQEGITGLTFAVTPIYRRQANSNQRSVVTVHYRAPPNRYYGFYEVAIWMENGEILAQGCKGL